MEHRDRRAYLRRGRRIHLRLASRIRHIWGVILSEGRLHARRDSGVRARPSLALPEAKQDLSGAPHGAPRDALRHRLEGPGVGLVLPMHQRIERCSCKGRRIERRHRRRRGRRASVASRVARGEFRYVQVAPRDLLGGGDILCRRGFPRSDSQRVPGKRAELTM